MISEEQKVCIVLLWLDYNYSRADVAESTGLCISEVREVLNEYINTGAHEPEEGMRFPAWCKRLPRKGLKRGGNNESISIGWEDR